MSIGVGSVEETHGRAGVSTGEREVGCGQASGPPGGSSIYLKAPEEQGAERLSSILAHWKGFLGAFKH